MSHAKQAPKRRRMRKTMPVLGAAAGLSLSLASGAPAAIGGLAAGAPTQNAASHEITLVEEEISDVSLATFHVFDRESDGMVRPHTRLAVACGGCAACGGCGGCFCGAGTNYGAGTNNGELTPWIYGDPRHPAKRRYKYNHALKRTPAPKNR
jgi:hypothetical protein